MNLFPHNVSLLCISTHEKHHRALTHLVYHELKFLIKRIFLNAVVVFHEAKPKGILYDTSERTDR